MASASEDQDDEDEDNHSSDFKGPAAVHIQERTTLLALPLWTVLLRPSARPVRHLRQLVRHLVSRTVLATRSGPWASLS